ncbi:MAG: vWA domain-containing protein [Candidatus Saccharibacteria bacterium]|nr:vWA domain-containing protein [Candidatus Saccharibacteria bacterium]
MNSEFHSSTSSSIESESMNLDSHALNLNSEAPSEELTFDQTLALRRQKAQRFLAPRRRLFSLFARDSSLKFTPSDSNETFAFDAQNFEIKVPLEWFSDDRFEDGELEFANYHELSHFIDMRKNPEAFLANFQHIRDQAKSLSDDYCRTHPEQSPTQVEPFFYREIHTLYNCLDDIYVNNLVLDRNHSFLRGDNQHSIATLYSKIGYEDPDQTDQPLHRQMAFSLLRDEMVGDIYGKSIVSDEVESVLSRKCFHGKTRRELIDEYLKPRHNNHRDDKLVDPEERYKLIRLVYEPAYLNLLKQALANAEQQQDQQSQKDQDDQSSDQSSDQSKQSQDNQNSQDSQNNQADSQSQQSQDEQNGQGSQSNQDNQQSQQSSSFDPFNDNQNSQPSPYILDHGSNPDKTTEEILKSFFNHDQEEQKKAAMSPQERAAYEQEKAQEAFDREHNISPDERTKSKQIEFEIEKPRRAMREFWKNLIGKSIQYRTEIEHGQRRGRLNIGDYIRQYSQLAEAERNGNLREAEIYDRRTTERLLVDQPDTIEVSLLVDCSGSMRGNRTDVARRTAALLMYSLKDFNVELHREHSSLHTDSQVITFGDIFEEIKPFARQTSSSDMNDANIIKSLSAIDATRNHTDDASPLEFISNSLSPHDRERMHSGKLLKILFEVTDGEPDDPEKTAEAVRALAESGVVVVGFQIGADTDDEFFSQIWNSSEKSSASHGIIIGDNLDSLPTKLMESLSNILGKIRIK